MSDREMILLWNNLPHFARFLKVICKLNLADKEETARVWGYIHETAYRWHKEYTKR